MLYLIEFCLHSKKCQIHQFFMRYVFIEFFIEIHIFVSNNLGDVCLCKRCILPNLRLNVGGVRFMTSLSYFFCGYLRNVFLFFILVVVYHTISLNTRIYHIIWFFVRNKNFILAPRHYDRWAVFCISEVRQVRIQKIHSKCCFLVVSNVLRSSFFGWKTLVLLV